MILAWVPVRYLQARSQSRRRLGWSQWVHHEHNVAQTVKGHRGNEWVFKGTERKCSSPLFKLLNRKS